MNTLLAITFSVILEFISQYPQVYQGSLNHRPAVVHYSGDYFYVIYVKKHPWGAYPVEIVKVDVKTFDEEVLYISEEIKA